MTLVQGVWGDGGVVRSPLCLSGSQMNNLYGELEKWELMGLRRSNSMSLLAFVHRCLFCVVVLETGRMWDFSFWRRDINFTIWCCPCPWLLLLPSTREFSLQRNGVVNQRFHENPWLTLLKQCLLSRQLHTNTYTPTCVKVKVQE